MLPFCCLPSLLSTATGDRPSPPQQGGVAGFTTLAWSRDGRHWVRNQTPYFEPDPDETAWDPAHAWMDYKACPLPPQALTGLSDELQHVLRPSICD